MTDRNTIRTFPLKVGLTGGIGSGKTTIAGIFEKLNYPVYISDREAARLINHDRYIREEFIKTFGHSVYNQDGILDKQVLAKFIFNDKKAMATVNGIVHPQVIKDFNRWIKKQTRPFVVFESAIIFENNLEGLFDYIVNITARTETRIARVVKRDNTTPEKVQERIDNQYNDEKRCQKSDFTISTDEERMLLEQVVHVTEQLDRLVSENV